MVTVIGGSGFIGSRLTNRLNDNGDSFRIVDKVQSPFFIKECLTADVRDIEELRRKLENSDVVINLAAEHRDDVSPKSLYDEVNIDGARNVCKACEDLNINKIIFTSSVAVYGFAPICTDETGKINYFNDYGRTKWEAEEVYREWYNKDPKNRSLIIIRPTVVFGERNRGNVYNLLKQISSGLFPMIGNGKNYKSMAYVENVAAFIQFCVESQSGYKVFNYIDKPDFDMNRLVAHVKKSLGKNPNTGFHWPYFLGLFGGYCFDLLAKISGKKLPISSIRIKKFCANTMFEPNNIKSTEFQPPVSIEEGIARTVKFEFLEDRDPDEVLFYSE
ncbi:MAG: NAD-dependent epimerase/dehydratase family protein [Spirochaetales bacterium]|uniref:NAD-dependent epimerase/dehydratase family protein n=1 Tax=Candidatus Thalassospirochaeta sargassi TaxID=3119039 RepID=A0AAJ1MJV2_9SPIO|nr:NAD-dependent epimerase/dehydratase family protein [Spirochaetales bacterium]